MLTSTLSHLRCPRSRCAPSELRLETRESVRLPGGGDEVVLGTLICPSCRKKFPILGGVAILVEELGDYLLGHIKGISREIPEAAYPKEFREAMIEARRELEAEHIEEDLESERVTALYLMTHYLRAEGGWWTGQNGSRSPEIEELVLRYWDHGPFERIRIGLAELFGEKKISLVELGCGVGGLSLALAGRLESYLGLDSSFAGIALARRLALGIDHRMKKDPAFKIPADLLAGGVSRDISGILHCDGAMKRVRADFVVADASVVPLRPAQWDACASLNMIDMLENPEELPRIQKQLIRDAGWAIQSSPYVWHPEVAKRLRKKFPKQSDSARAISAMYEAAGFSVERSEDQVPWVFFKHLRQVELYSVHLLFARVRR